MGYRELLKTLKNITSIQCLIVEDYVYKKDHISKWFSVLEVSRELMNYEQKVTFNHGKIVKNENKQWYHQYALQSSKTIVTEFLTGGVIEKEYDRQGKLQGTTNYSEEKFWNIHFDFDIKAIYNQDAKFNQYNDVISETAIVNGERQVKTYEYKYDQHANWIEKSIFINSRR